jgi:hypothetical protein
MGVFIMILSVILGIFIATITWKVYPYFLSRRDYYRNSPYEIIKLRGIATIVAFILTVFYGGVVVESIHEKEKGENTKIESTTHKTKFRKKKAKNKTVSNSHETTSETPPIKDVQQLDKSTENETSTVSIDSIRN